MMLLKKEIETQHNYVAEFSLVIVKAESHFLLIAENIPFTHKITNFYFTVINICSVELSRMINIKFSMKRMNFRMFPIGQLMAITLTNHVGKG